MSDPPILTCWTVSGDEQATALKDIENAEAQTLHQEKGKKSSFLLNLDDGVLLERPDQTQIIVENNPELQNHFFLGGFQIISNAKQSKVYLTGRDGQENYLTTSKGIPFEKESGKQWYKSVCVVPGGPRLVTRLRLEILNVQAHQEGDASTLTKIRYLKLTARIPDKPMTSPAPNPKQNQLGAVPISKLQQGAGSAFYPAPPALSAMFHAQNGSAFVPTGMNNKPSNLGAMPPPSMAQAFGGSAFSAPQMKQTPPPLTQDDLGAAMAGISMMARSTQENMEKSFDTKVTEMQEHMDAQWGKVEGYVRVLTQVVVSQKTVLEEKNKIMQQQHEMVAEQSRQIATLLIQQTELQSTVQSLQSDMKALQQQQVGKSLDPAAATVATIEAQNTAIASPRQSLPLEPTPSQESSDAQEYLESVAKMALAEQESAVTPAIESIQKSMESLNEYIKGNQTQDLLKDTLENIQTDVRALKETSASAKDMPNLQEEKLSSTLEALQSEMVRLRQSMEVDSGKRDQMSTALENLQSTLTKLEQVEPKGEPNPESSLLQEHQQKQEKQQLALSASVDALEKDVATLRESVDKTAQEGSSQQKALENNLDSLKSDLSEMQKTMQENAESMKQTTAVEEDSKPRAKEIVVTGIRDFENDIFAIRSLEGADDSMDDDEKKDYQQQRKEVAETKQLIEPEPRPSTPDEIAGTKGVQLIELETYPRPLTPDRPPRENVVVKESLVLKQSIEALKEFREIHQIKDQVKSASSGDSTATHGSRNSTSPAQSVSSTSTPSTSTPPITNVSAKPPIAPNSAGIPPPSLNQLVSTGSLVDNEDDELIDGEIVETDVSYSDDGEYIVSVETQDAYSGEVVKTVDGKVETEEAAMETTNEPPSTTTIPTKPPKRNLGSLVMEPNGSLVVDVDEDGSSLDEINLPTSDENEGGAKATNTINDENTSNNVVSEAPGEQVTPKNGKRVSFRDTALEDRYEYSPDAQTSGSTGDSVGTEESESEGEGILEMGMKLFNNAGWL